MATIKDVARLAGVGLGTASRVISGKGAVSAATAARVRQAIAELDFRPSHTARALLTGCSQMIGVYIPMLRGAFYSPILQLIDTELRANGQHMVVAIGSGRGTPHEQTCEGITFLHGRGCDGIVVVSNALSDEDVERLGAISNSIVVVNHIVPSIKEQCFAVDHRQGGRLAARTLLEAGHRRLAAVSGPADVPDNALRMEGFLKEVAAQLGSADWVAIVTGDFSPASGRQAADALLAAGDRFTALFCANDEMAIGALSCFQQAGIQVPQRVSVLGYDDIPTAEYAAPPLTSVHVPWATMTHNALNFLLNRCYGNERPVRRRFSATVTWRASVAAARRR